MKAAIVVLAGIALTAAMLAWRLPGTYRSLPVLQPDSATYLEWHAMRPPVYPLALNGVRAVSPSLDSLGPLQLGLFLACGIWLSLAFARAIGHAWLAMVLGAGIMLHPQVVSYAFTALAESLLTCLVMMHAAATLQLITERRLKWAVLSGVALAAAVLTKPVAVAFGAGVVVIASTLWRAPARVRLLSVWIASIALPVAAVSAVNVVRIGQFSPQVIGGYAMLGVTGTFMPDETPPETPALHDRLLRAIAPVRDELKEMDDLDMYYFYSSAAYHLVLEASTATILDYLQQSDPTASKDRQFFHLNTIGQRTARAAIQHAPREYMRHVAAHLYGLWMMPLVQNADRRQELEARLQTVRQQAPILARQPINFRFVPAVAYWLLKLVFLLAVVCSFAALAGWIRSPRAPAWVCGAYAGVLLHSYFLVTAMTQTGLPRYTIVAWPLTMLVLCGVAAAIVPRLGGGVRLR